jgi:hypothetical protein
MTAQNTDIVPFTETDYNALRQSIYSPTIEPTVEVNSLFYI